MGRSAAKPRSSCAKRLEGAELAPAFEPPPPYDSASPSSVAALRRVDKLDALHTLHVAVHPQRPSQPATILESCSAGDRMPADMRCRQPSFNRRLGEHI